MDLYCVLGLVGRYRELRADRLHLTERLSVVVDRFLRERPLFGRLRQDVFPLVQDGGCHVGGREGGRVARENRHLLP